MKEKGKKGFRFYSDDLHQQAKDKLTLRSDLAAAIEREEFELFYQPKVDSKSGAVLGAESLIRWRHPERGLVGPAEFIEELEKSGAICEVGRWAIQTAGAQLQQWQLAGYENIKLSTNVSPRQFSDPKLLEHIESTLVGTEIQPSLFEIEITESTACGDFNEALLVMKQMTDLGVSLSLDDFGTGQSSLQYLHRMPISILKIDQSFIQQIGHDGAGELIVNSVINLGQTMGIDIISEGVETYEQLAYLGDRNCHYIQGYYFSPPVTAQEFEVLLAEGFPDKKLIETQENPLVAIGL